MLGANLGEDDRIYRKGLKIEWGDKEKVSAYRRAWWRERRGKIAQTRKRLKEAWVNEHQLAHDRIRAMREFARQEAARRGVDAIIVYREWNCLTPREKMREEGGA